MTETAVVDGKEYKISEHPMEPKDQMALIKIGRIVEKEFPEVKFNSMEDLRLYANQHLGTNIKNGMRLGEVATMLFNAQLHAAHKRTYGIV